QKQVEVTLLSITLVAKFLEHANRVGSVSLATTTCAEDLFDSVEVRSDLCLIHVTEALTRLAVFHRSSVDHLLSEHSTLGLRRERVPLLVGQFISAGDSCLTGTERLRIL